MNLLYIHQLYNISTLVNKIIKYSSQITKVFAIYKLLGVTFKYNLTIGNIK